VTHGARLTVETAAGDRDREVVLAVRLAMPSGCWMIMRSTDARNRPHVAAVDRDLARAGLIQTRAMAFLRLPVA